MELQVADIVKSTAGHDSGNLMLVVNTASDWCSLADGKTRKIENPKRKNLKHVLMMQTGNDALAEALREGRKVSNKAIRKALAEYAGQSMERKEI